MHKDPTFPGVLMPTLKTTALGRNTTMTYNINNILGLEYGVNTTMTYK